MNPDPTFWLQLFGRLALFGGVLVGAAALATIWTKSAVWARAVWQACLLGLLLLLGFELTGASQGLWPFDKLRTGPRDRVEKNPPTTQTVVVATDMPGASVPVVIPDWGSSPISSPRPPTSSPASIWTAAWWPAAVWLAGLVVLLVRGGFVRAFLAWRWKNRRAITAGPLWSRTHDLAHRLNLRRALVAEVEGLPTPIAFGLWRPTVCLPERFAVDFTPAQQDAMLAHELAHVAARDPAWYALAGLVTALWWWHPLVWWARRQLRESSESAADEISVLWEDGPGALAECLVAVGRRLAHHPDSAWAGVGGTGLKSGLARRVTRLLELSNGRPAVEVVGRRPGLLRMIALSLFAMIGIAVSAWPAGQSSELDPTREAWRKSLGGRAWQALKANEPARLMAQAQPPPSPASGRQNDNLGNPEPERLLTRTFKLDEHSVRQALHTIALREKAVAPSKDLSPDDFSMRLRGLFEAAGADFSGPGKAAFWNDRSGLLMARATAADLDIIEQVVSFLCISPPQVTIDVKFAEIDEGEAGPGALYHLMGMSPDTNRVARTASIPPADPAARVSMNGGVRLQSVSNVEPAVIAGVLKPAQFRAVVRLLEQRNGVNVLSSPKVTTQSGRQAQIKVVSVKYVVTELDHSKDGKPKPVTEPMEFGPILDVVPYVNADGRTIHLTVIPTVKEFLGYDLEAGQRFDAQNPVPLPMFRIRQAVGSASMQDGQTMVLSPGTIEVEANPNTNEGATSPGRKTRKTLLIFVTPTLIDPAGNRIHSPDEASRKHNALETAKVKTTTERPKP